MRFSLPYPRSYLVNGGLCLFTVLVIGHFVPHLAAFVLEAGNHLSSPNVALDYITGLVWAIILGITIPLWPVRNRDKLALILLWGIKVIITLGVMLIYEHHYGLDADTYFSQSRTIPFAWHLFDFGNGTTNVPNLLRIQNMLVPASYHAQKVSCSMLGLIGIYLYYRAACLYLCQENRKILYLVGLFPSVLFWSSILGKDPITFLGIAMYTYGVLGWYRQHRWKFIIVLLAGVLLTAFIRVWLAPIMLFPLTAFFMLSRYNIIYKIALLACALVAFYFGFMSFAQQFSIDSAQAAVQTAQSVSHSWQYGGSGEKVGFQFNSPISMLEFMPLGTFTALFRPLPGEVMNPFGLAAGLQNAVLLFFLALAIKRTRLRELKDPILAWAIFLIVGWAAIYGFVSYQNLGSASRFKIQVLPVLWLVLLYLSRPRVTVKRQAVSNLPQSDSTAMRHPKPAD